MFKGLLRTLAITAALAGGAGSAEAAVFSFTYVAPLDVGDTASGMGTITTKDADDLGRYLITGATGSYKGYEGDDQGRRITDVGGWNGLPYIYADPAGTLVTDGLTIIDGDYPFLAFTSRNGSSYAGRYGEVSIVGGSLTFSPSVAGAVPEPASWALMIAGVGAAGAGLRRRRVRVAFA